MFRLLHDCPDGLIEIHKTKTPDRETRPQNNDSNHPESKLNPQRQEPEQNYVAFKCVWSTILMCVHRFGEGLSRELERGENGGWATKIGG